uniref:Transposase IS204/IS1001/IS1096/IS1165 DDE domain-containing protein n=5 Tax=unclassified Prevotella TaxID=2638335 RepID=A0AB33JPL9_9BACT
MDTYPITARSLGLYFKVDGNNLERAYKNHLSGFRDWEQADHAAEWILIPENIGKRLGIDETMLHKDLMTFLTNKDGHGKRHTLIAAVRGTRASDVVKVLMQIPQEQREQVEEVTMDFSDSMYAIVTEAFPKATIVIDCFHIIKRCIEAVEELRLKAKREAQKALNKEKAKFKKKLEQLVKSRKYYRKKHPKKYKGKKRGRKPQRLNKRFRPTMLSNGESVIELLTRSKFLLSVSGEKWTDRQKIRARLLFKLFPKIKDAYTLICSLRCIFSSKDINRTAAKDKLHDWYQKVSACTLREVKAARDAIKYKEEEVLNYFINRSTNAHAESLNSKLKGFRAQLRGVQDLPFFMYRTTMIFG